MPQFCSSCGTQMADGTTVCPGCGKAASGAAATSAPAGGGLQDNVAGMLAYLFIPAILFLVLEPYNRNKFIRFHAFQSLFLTAAWIALCIVLSIIAAIPFFGWFTLLLWPLISIGFFVLWIILMVKAYGNQKFKLPFIGDLAEQQA
jgi:uncharacterized membrane protein